MAQNIEPRSKLISKYLELKEKEFFVIPEYQRAYSWNISQCDKLWQDIEAFIEQGANDPYFFGTIIVDCSEEEEELKLIDGQQRTITFFLLLKALLIRIQEILERFKEDKDSKALKLGLENKRQTIIKILYKAKNEDKYLEILENWKNARNIKILENKSINEQFKKEFQKIVESENFNEAKNEVYKKPRKQKDNKYTNYFRNFKLFYEKLREKSESQLNQFARVFLENCEIIEIRSWKTEQAITMFNSLNSTGMPLSDADIISAQLYSKAGKQKEKFNEKWENINKLTDELDALKIINIDSVLQQFMYINRAINKEYIKGQSVDVTTPGVRKYYTEMKKELLNEPLKLCDNFLKIAQIWDKIKDDTIIKLLLKFNENIKLFLASYLYRFEIDEITQTEAKEKILAMSETLLRLFVLLELVDSGYSSKNFKTFLFKENIKLVDKSIDENEIIKDFNIHINKNWNQKLIEELIRDYDKNPLVYLNEYLYAKEKNKTIYFFDRINIEHIMPASGRNVNTIRQDAGITDKEEFKMLVNKIGNKILLEENINKAIGNEWFKTKKQTSIKEKTGYKDSKYPIANDLINYHKDTWTKEDIENATEKAVNRIIKFIFQKN